VNFRLEDTHNFDPSQLGYEQAEILKKCANAKDYPIASYWTATVSGTLNARDGSGILKSTLLYIPSTSFSFFLFFFPEVNV